MLLLLYNARKFQIIILKAFRIVSIQPWGVFWDIEMLNRCLELCRGILELLGMHFSNLENF